MGDVAVVLGIGSQKRIELLYNSGGCFFIQIFKFILVLLPHMLLLELVVMKKLLIS